MLPFRSATKCDPAVDENESSCGCFTFLEPAVTTALSLILEKEMKEAYGDQLWTEIVYIKPPWTLTGEKCYLHFPKLELLVALKPDGIFCAAECS